MSRQSNFKSSLRELKQLQADGRTKLYRRVELCRALMNDSEFLSHSGDEWGAADTLAALLDDVLIGDIGLRDLIDIFEMFPERKVWETRSLRHLFAETRIARIRQKAQASKAVPQKRTPPVSMSEAIEDAAVSASPREETDWREKCRQLEQENHALRSQLSEARSENRRLRKLLGTELVPQ